MSKSSLIAVLALIASASAQRYVYSYGTLPYAAPQAAYTDYTPFASLTSYPRYQTAYASAYSNTYPAYSAGLAAPLTVPRVYASSYAVDEFASLVNPAAAPLTTVADAVAFYGSPYSYLLKR
ncbi:uncharacterized protein LOC118272591 [Spodoptera frugiperda]|uniref:Uncharacterized protein LOC118272591 n=1 Tax=Spodoptera frugiperda TaxID=7108 RepID=A0A9R0EME4_SPOFR|nr:uncharacterized protein LOC118272591 [Spodoptera frugiperda]